MNEIIKHELAIRIKELLNYNPEDVSLNEIMEICYATTKANGFDLKGYIKQMLFILTEVGEALEELKIDDINTNSQLISFNNKAIMLAREIEQARKETFLEENTQIANKEHFVEEIVDIIIRCFSLLTHLEADTKYILKKMFINTQREYLHGKKN